MYEKNFFAESEGTVCWPDYGLDDHVAGHTHCTVCQKNKLMVLESQINKFGIILIQAIDFWHVVKAIYISAGSDYKQKSRVNRVTSF